MDATPDLIDGYQMSGQDIPTLLGHWATRRPDHPALVWDPFEGEGRSWTYAQLRDDVHRLAAGLADRGIALGDKVLLPSENCPEMVEDVSSSSAIVPFASDEQNEVLQLRECRTILWYRSYNGSRS